MKAYRFLQTPLGRTLRIIAGLAILIFGAGQASLGGITSAMTGVVVVVTGLAGIPSPPYISKPR